VATQKLRQGDHFSPTLPLYIFGKSDAYTKPVYVLTSPQTGSAAEAFAIATMPIAHIKRIGSPTAGAMSTALEKQLPNSWTFSISNEIYMDNEGNNYENKGIPVDYDLNYPKDRQTFFRSVANDLEADKQNILQAISSIE
jgi:C-terminal processing protease CtpA/Prc